MTFLPSDPPGPPENFNATDISKTSCTLTWQPPAFDGGSPIKGYYIEKCSGYSSRWSKVNREPVKRPTIRLDDLDEGTEYKFRVCAENEAGIGKPSEPIAFTAKNPYDIPGKPSQPTVEKIDKDGATLAWSPPDSDGGAPIDKYVVEVREQGETKWRPASGDGDRCAFTATGLKEGTSYEFRVSAQNKAGQGAPSTPSKSTKYGKTPRLQFVIIKWLMLLSVLLHMATPE